MGNGVAVLQLYVKLSPTPASINALYYFHVHPQGIWFIYELNHKSSRFISYFHI